MPVLYAAVRTQTTQRIVEFAKNFYHTSHDSLRQFSASLGASVAYVPAQQQTTGSSSRLPYESPVMMAARRNLSSVGHYSPRAKRRKSVSKKGDNGSDHKKEVRELREQLDSLIQRGKNLSRSLEKKCRQKGITIPQVLIERRDNV